jgi:NifU-like protein involved in Fe-S cluster formation
MGTIVDYAYRFDGSPKAVASARAAIAAIQAKYADVSSELRSELDAVAQREELASMLAPGREAGPRSLAL